ncbi:hypothetical protein C8Q77DRAFT_738842 [Trametes polyzona]|nr:hypothetical protein C8Q77DRAFT_738842 [Trametes polyzona]
MKRTRYNAAAAHGRASSLTVDRGPESYTAHPSPGAARRSQENGSHTSSTLTTTYTMHAGAGAGAEKQMAALQLQHLANREFDGRALQTPSICLEDPRSAREFNVGSLEDMRQMAPALCGRRAQRLGAWCFLADAQPSCEGCPYMPATCPYNGICGRTYTYQSEAPCSHLVDVAGSGSHYEPKSFIRGPGHTYQAIKRSIMKGHQ